MGLFFGIVFAAGIFVSSSFFCFSYVVIEAYFFVYSMIFFIPSAPLIHISGVIIQYFLYRSQIVHCPYKHWFWRAWFGGKDIQILDFNRRQSENQPIS
jgi:hypothetical protein